jgi:predicted nucleotidyltransferase
MRWAAALKLLQEHKQELEGRYGITRLGIFGSVARDEAADESDVGVVVEMAPNLFRRVSLKEELETIREAKVDLVRYWRRMNHYLKRRIGIEVHYVW